MGTILYNVYQDNRKNIGTGNTTTYFTDGLKYKSTDGFVKA